MVQTMFSVEQVQEALDNGYTYDDLLPYLARDYNLDITELRESGYPAKVLVEEALKRPKPIEQTIQEAKDEKGFFDPNAPQETSYTRIGASTVLGGGIGFALGGPIGFGAGVLSGLGSGLAGEIARSQGLSDFWTLTAEIGGGMPQAITKFGIYGVPNMFLPKEKALLIQNFLGSKGDKNRAILWAKEKVFGPDKFKGMYSSQYADKTQVGLRSSYNIIGDNGKKVSDILRERMLSGIEKLKGKTKDIEVQVPKEESKLILPKGVEQTAKTEIQKVPNVFFHSSDFKVLLQDLNALAKRGIIDKTDVPKVVRMAKNQVDDNPLISGKATEDILNFIQNRGVKLGKKEGERIYEISEGTQKALRQHFDSFLSTNSDEISYNALKKVEQEEFIAEAMDSIDLMVKTGFSMKDDAFRQALKNINQHPEGKVRFAKAIDNHFRNFGETLELPGGWLGIPGTGTKKVGGSMDKDQLFKEFKRLRPAIEETGIMTRDQLLDLTKKIDMLSPKLGKQQFVDVITQGLGGAIAIESAQKLDEEYNYSVFSL